MEDRRRPDRSADPPGQRAGEAEGGHGREEAGFEEDWLGHRQVEPDLGRVPKDENGKRQRRPDPAATTGQEDSKDQLLGQGGHEDRHCCYR